MSEVTRILDRAGQGDPKAAQELLPLVYEELRKLAAHKMAQERTGQTLQATALVHEAWLRLTGSDKPWQNRGHFFSAASEAMRRILIERARRRQRLRHGGGLERADIDGLHIAVELPDDRLLALDAALEELERENPEKASVVKLRYFIGLSNHEAAETLGVSVATVERHWAFAKAWLYDRLRQPEQAQELPNKSL
jgi:RNA polymerase sigma factor (TIGR02999 family)